MRAPRPVPKSPAEGVITAVVVGGLIFVFLAVGLGVDAGDALLVVLVFTAFMTLADLLRGRYRHPDPLD